jgi:hypothetical protein
MGKFYKQMEALYDMAEFSWAADNASRPGTLASSLDGLITSKDTIEQIVAQAAAEGQKRRHQTKYTEGTIHSHIKFRVQQAARNKKAK